MAGYQYKTSAVAFRDEIKGRNLSENQRKQLNEYKKRFQNYDWKSDLEYDAWDDEDQERKAAGKLPKKYEKTYDMSDPVDRALYYNGLPARKNIASKAKDADKYREKLQAEVDERNFRIGREEAKKEPFRQVYKTVRNVTGNLYSGGNDSAQKPAGLPMVENNPQPYGGTLNKTLGNGVQVYDLPGVHTGNAKWYETPDVDVMSSAAPVAQKPETWESLALPVNPAHMEVDAVSSAQAPLPQSEQYKEWLQNNPQYSPQESVYKFNEAVQEKERMRQQKKYQITNQSLAQTYHNPDFEFQSGSFDFDTLPDKTKLRVLQDYSYMTEEQKQIFTYWAERDPQTAERYLDGIQDEINATKGYAEAKETLNSPQRGLKASGNAFVGGLDKFAASLGDAWGMMKGDYTQSAIPASNYAHAFTTPELPQGERIMADVLYSGANMLPNALLGAVNPTLGLATTAVSTFGSSYGDAMREGKTVSQAQKMATLSALSETGLQYVLGGITGLAGKHGGQLSKGIKKVLGRATEAASKTKLGGFLYDLTVNAGSEFVEEYLQETFESQFRNLAYGENNEYQFFSEEALYAGVLGAISSAGMNAATDVMTGRFKNATPELVRRAQEAVASDGDASDQATVSTLSPLPMAEMQSPAEPEPLPTVETEERPVQVGKATTIRAPYHGKTPVQTRAGGQVAIPVESVVKAREMIIEAENTKSETKSFKSILKGKLEGIYGNRYGGIYVPVMGTVFDGQQYNVKVFKNAIGKVVSDAKTTPEKISVLEKLPELIQNGEYVGSGRYNKAKSKGNYVTRYDYFETPVDITDENGKVNHYIVAFDVEAYTDRNQFRTYKLNEMSLIPVSGSAMGSHPGGTPKTGLGPASDYHNLSENAIQNREKISPKSLPVVEGEISKTPDAGSDIVETLPMTEDFARDGADPAEIKLNRFGDTIVESERFSREGREAVEQARDAERKAIEQSAEIDAMWHHTVQTDKDAVSLANAEIEKLGLQGAAEALETVLKSGQELDKNTVTKGVVIALQAQRNGDVQMFERLMGRLAAKGAQYGGAIQALSLAKKLSPYGRLEFFNMMIDDINAKYAKKLKGKEVSIDESLKQSLLSAKTAEEIAQAESAIFSSIAKQTPSTFPEQLRNVRYFMMLANPKTHIKNIFGNFASDLVRVMKDRVGTVLEKAIPKEKRTKTTAGYLTKEYWNARKIALKDFDSIQEMVENGTRYDNRSKIDQEKDTFNGKNIAAKTANAFIRGNTKLLSAEDTLFLKNVYADAFAQVAKARGYDAAQIQEHIGEIREYAVREAQKTTFHNSNKFADWLQKLENTGMAGAIISQGVVPFKKTPANVVTRTIEYSPAGIVKTVFENVQDAKKGRFDVAKLIDGISANLTGTALVGLGAYLASIGFLNGSGSDDESKKYFDEARGIQSNSINICGRTYTIEDLGPLAAPLIIGANIYDSRENGSPNTLDDILDGLAGVASPVFELTFLQGLSDALDASYGEDPLTGLFATALKSLLAQTTKPSAVGAITRTIDGTRRDTYVSKNNKLGSWGKTVNQIKNAWAPSTLPEYVDRWGRPEKEENTLSRFVENFLLPTYTSEISYDPADIEIDRLYDATKSASVLPGKYFDGEIKYDDVSYYATPEERQRFLTTRGQSDYELVSELIDLPLYKELSDEDKADVFSAVYSYSEAKAKQEFFESRGVEYELPAVAAKAEEASKYDLSPAEWFIIRDMVNGAEYDAAYDKAKSNAHRSVIYGLPMVDWQKDGLFELFDVSPEYKKETLKKGD